MSETSGPSPRERANRMLSGKVLGTIVACCILLFGAISAGANWWFGLPTELRTGIWPASSKDSQKQPVLPSIEKRRQNAEWITLNNQQVTFTEVGFVPEDKSFIFEARGLWSPREGYACLDATKGVQVRIVRPSNSTAPRSPEVLEYTVPFEIKGPAYVYMGNREAVTGGLSADNGPCPGTVDQLRAALY